MNERIQELAEQAYTIALKESKDESGPNLCAPGSNYFIGLAQEKFAELIIQECLAQVWYTREDSINGNISEVIKERMKEHFGVRE